MLPALPFKLYAEDVWRVVEAQHIVSTMKLVDSAAEQDVLESVLETSKPPVPPECQHLDYLLSTPFRYGLYPRDSRFRRAGETLGVFYAAEEPITAVAETVWYRQLFYRASPDTPLPNATGQYTAFCVPVRTETGIDLTKPPLQANSALWTDPNDYSACLDLADQVREQDGEIIRYASVRHPDALPNVAVLQCRAFAKREPVQRQTWHIFLRPGRAQVRCEYPRLSIEFLADKSRLSFA